LSITETIAPLAVSLGDPAGVGPELICEAWARREAAGLRPFFVVGGADILKSAAATRGLDIPIRIIAAAEDATAQFADAMPVLAGHDGAYQPGKPERDGAEIAFASLKQATSLTVLGVAGGLVTAPIAKGLLAEVGFTFPGQTEFVAQACDVIASQAVMLLAGPTLRTVPLTVHVAIAQVPVLISEELIRSRATITARWLARDFGIENPRLAITALNPHGGEGGKFGDEEERIIAPAIAALQADGIDATGPYSADALFTPHMRGGFDVALCMYHDQALIPIKALEFDEGVNVTLGLPIVRTSPDHGTAFDIAGTGKAHPGAMIAAIRMAGECAARRVANA